MKRETLINAISPESLKTKIPRIVWSTFSYSFDQRNLETDRRMYMRKLIFSAVLDNVYEGRD